jgi:uncharacterized protein GlcG (DUF336 family)
MMAGRGLYGDHSFHGNETIGGIAVAGAPGGDKDEACARAGLDKVKDQLS